MKSLIGKLLLAAAFIAPLLSEASSTSGPFFQQTRNDPRGHLTLLTTPKSVAPPPSLQPLGSALPVEVFAPSGSFLRDTKQGRMRFGGATFLSDVQAAPAAPPLQRFQTEREAALARRRELEVQRQQLEAEIQRLDHFLSSLPEPR